MADILEHDALVVYSSTLKNQNLTEIETRDKKKDSPNISFNAIYILYKIGHLSIIYYKKYGQIWCKS